MNSNGNVPKVSVVIPVYNGAAFIREAVQSVLNQTVPPAEIIVVNDGSTDMDYLTLEALHPSVRVVQQTNQGVAVARNSGYEASSGDLIAILDGDDAWLPEKLDAQVSYLNEHPDVDAVFTRGLNWRPQDGKWIWPQVEYEYDAAEADPVTYRDFILKIAVCPSSMLIRRDVWRSVGGYDKQFRLGQDFDFYLRLSAKHRVASLRNTYSLYREHSSNCTKSHSDSNALATVIKLAIRTTGLSNAFGSGVTRAEFRRRVAYLHFEHGYMILWGAQPTKASPEFLRAAYFGAGMKAFVYCAVAAIPGLHRVLSRAARLVRDTDRSSPLPSSNFDSIVEIKRS